jgi:hypothetical protein
MTFPIHTIELPDGSPPQNSDRLGMLMTTVAVPAAGAAVVTLGTITPGIGFDILPAIAPTGGTLTAGVSPADPAVVRATSLKAVGTPTVVAPGSGVAINDTFNLAGGALAVAGPAGNTTGTAGVPAKVTVSHIQVVSAVVNAVGASGTAGATILTGTTGTGTKWTGTATIGAGGTLTAGAIIPITLAGDYTVTPTLAGDAVTNTDASLTGATVTLLMGAKTLSLTTAGGYAAAPPLAGTPGVNVVGTGTGVTVASTYGLGSAVIDHSGNYSVAPSFTVTPNDSVGTTASIATATLGSAGTPVTRSVPTNIGANGFVMASAQSGLDATCSVVSQVGTSPNNAAPYVSISVQPRLAANTLGAGQISVLAIA